MTARERVEALGWTHQEPRSSYDTAIVGVLEALVEDLEQLRNEVRHLGYVVSGGEAS
jgi:hypothetical protein